MPAPLELTNCRSCGDRCSADRIYDGWPRCKVCYLELAHGEVTCQNIQISFGGRATREDDGGPWQQNAVRELEDY